MLWVYYFQKFSGSKIENFQKHDLSPFDQKLYKINHNFLFLHSRRLEFFLKDRAGRGGLENVENSIWAKTWHEPFLHDGDEFMLDIWEKLCNTHFSSLTLGKQ